jgi:hypothetical protein
MTNICVVVYGYCKILVLHGNQFFYLCLIYILFSIDDYLLGLSGNTL